MSLPINLTGSIQCTSLVIHLIPYLESEKRLMLSEAAGLMKRLVLTLNATYNAEDRIKKGEDLCGGLHSPVAAG